MFTGFSFFGGTVRGTVKGVLTYTHVVIVKKSFPGLLFLLFTKSSNFGKIHKCLSNRLTKERV